MSNDKLDLMDAISMLAREKDINEGVLVDTIEEALKVAYRRNNKVSNTNLNLTAHLSKKEGAKLYARKTVAEIVEEPDLQISRDEALKIRSDYQIGDIGHWRSCKKHITRNQR